MLNVTDATLGYNGKPLLHMDRLTLAAGEECLLTGVSGSGKTTLLYAIAGLQSVISGSITVGGTVITALSGAERDRFRGRHIGMIFQTLHLVSSLSVLDNLLLGAYAASLPQQPALAMETLEKLGIAHKKHHLPASLSQGQAQRVAIARAMLHKPQLILADEPTSSLDDISCAKVITLIRDAARMSGAALLISTHDSRVKSYFSKVIQLEGEA